MICKTFEIRDSATFIPVLAIKLMPNGDKDRYLLARAGYGLYGDSQSNYVILVKLVNPEAQYDPHSWLSSARTMQVAHQYIVENFQDMHSGEVVDVEFILGESTTKKVSEQVVVPYEDEVLDL